MGIFLTTTKLLVVATATKMHPRLEMRGQRYCAAVQNVQTGVCQCLAFHSLAKKKTAAIVTMAHTANKPEMGVWYHTMLAVVDNTTDKPVANPLTTLSACGMTADTTSPPPANKTT